MRRLLLPTIVFLPLIAGCIAFGADTATPGGMIEVSWKTALTVYGPMGGIIIWFMAREKKRDERLFALVEKCTEVMTKVEAALAQSSADNEKNRHALYRLAEEVRDSTGGSVRANTRIMDRID